MQVIEGAYAKRKKFAESILPIIQSINPNYYFREDQYAWSFNYWIMEKLEPKKSNGLLQEIFDPLLKSDRTVCSISFSEERLCEKSHWTVSVGDTEEMKQIGQTLEDQTGIPVTVVTA